MLFSSTGVTNNLPIVQKSRFLAASKERQPLTLLPFQPQLHCGWNTPI
jgi:hypothetical protein